MAEPGIKIFIVVKSNYAKMEIFIRLDTHKKSLSYLSFHDTGIRRFLLWMKTLILNNKCPTLRLCSICKFTC